MTASCRSCGAPIVFAVTERGKRIPIDAEPVENGNIALDRLQEPPRAYVLKTATAREMVEGNLYVLHFSTCPNAAQHRRPAQPVAEEAGSLKEAGEASSAP